MTRGQLTKTSATAVARSSHHSTPEQSERLRVNSSIRQHVLATAIAVLVLGVGVGGIMANTDIAGAVIAPGNLVVETNVKKVQHPSGGVVGEIRVKEGDRVHVGDILVKLDPTQTQSNLAIVVQTLNELRARRSRLLAERDGSSKIDFPDQMLKDAKVRPDIARLLTSEQRFFELRSLAREGQKSQLNEKVSQLKQQIAGQTQQSDAKKIELDFVSNELVGVRELYSKGLVQLTRLTTLERDSARLKGDLGQLSSSMAEARGKIVETQLQILQIDQDLRAEVAKDLSETESKIAEQSERKVAAEDLLNRIDIRSPADGVVYQMSANTVGGTIDKNEVIMMIVPVDEQLTVEAKITPNSIDQVHVGQTAILRFSAFNQRTTPEIKGTVSRVAADAAVDQKTNVASYLIRIEIPASEIALLGKVKLLPGMPVEVFVQTDTRTIASYLVKPLADQIKRAFREH